MIRKPGWHFFTGMALVMVLLMAADEAAGATASRVVLLRPGGRPSFSGSGSLTGAGADALARQGMTLLMAELRAVGFEVVEVDGDSHRELRRDIEAVSARLQPVATFAIVPVAGGTSVELWLQDRVTGKLVIRSVQVSGDAGAAADLAVKAVELLRGSLLEVTMQAPGAGATPSAAPVDVRRFVAEAAADRLSYFAQGIGVAAGARALRTAGLEPVYAPLLRVSWGTTNGNVFGLSASGWGSAAAVRAMEGTAEVRQTLLLLEVGRVFRPRARLQPFAGLVAGAHRAHVVGTGVSSLFPSGAGTGTALAAGVEVGLAARLGNRLALVVEGSLLGSVPRTTVRIAGGDSARTGGVGAAVAISLTATF